MLSNQSHHISYQLGVEIKQLIQSSDLVYREALTEDTRLVADELRDDINSWILKLKERSISCYELDHLLESKRDKIHLPNLEAIGLEGDELYLIKNEILRVLAKSVMNSYFNSLFKNQLKSKNTDLKKQIFF